MSVDTPRAGDPATSGAPDAAPIRVIFVCTGNSARSQMAEALLRHDGGGRFDVVSAGVDPKGVHPMTITALAKAGIDISGAIAGEIPAVDKLDKDPITTIKTGDWVEIDAPEVGEKATVTITRKG